MQMVRSATQLQLIEKASSTLRKSPPNSFSSYTTLQSSVKLHLASIVVVLVVVAGSRLSTLWKPGAVCKSLQLSKDMKKGFLGGFIMPTYDFAAKLAEQRRCRRVAIAQ